MDIDFKTTDPAAQELLDRRVDPVSEGRYASMTEMVSDRLANSRFQVFDTFEEFWAAALGESEVDSPA